MLCGCMCLHYFCTIAEEWSCPEPEAHEVVEQLGDVRPVGIRQTIVSAPDYNEPCAMMKQATRAAWPVSWYLDTPTTPQKVLHGSCPCRARGAASRLRGYFVRRSRVRGCTRRPGCGRLVARGQRPSPARYHRLPLLHGRRRPHARGAPGRD